MNNTERAAEIEEIAEMMSHYAKILRGEVQDLTGLGHWRIMCDHLERVMNVKVITADQYAAFVELSNEDFKRRGGRTSY